jgi:hypothetical protein
MGIFNLEEFYQEFSLIFGSILISIYLAKYSKEINYLFVVIGIGFIALHLILKNEYPLRNKNNNKP